MISCLKLHGEISVNSYIISNYGSKHILLIDPGANFSYISSLIKKNNYVLDKILITHGHFDHIGAVNQLIDKYKCPLYAHTNSKLYFQNPVYNLSEYDNNKIIINNYNELKSKDLLDLSGDIPLVLEVLHTPGHTSDSIIFYNKLENFAVTGDIVFKNSIGAYHYPGGDLTTLLKSIKSIILNLPKNCTLYTGHGESTTVGEIEKFLKLSGLFSLI